MDTRGFYVAVPDIFASLTGGPETNQMKHKSFLTIE